MGSESTPAQRRAVAPPGRSERALISWGSMPVESWRDPAACRKALVTNRAGVLYQPRWSGCAL